MRTEDLVARFSGTTQDQCKAIFSSIFIIGNRLRTLFDARIPELSLKQFMLLSVARQSSEPQTYTELGEILGCSRQNIRKLADALERKGFIRQERHPGDPRAMRIRATDKAHAYFQGEFAPYQEELRLLFEVYTPDEIRTLFELLSRMYEGMKNLAAKAADA